jgi:hypothetical protein
METKHTNESITDTFKTGLAGIYKVSGGILKPFFTNKVSILSIIVSIAFTVIATTLKTNLYSLIVEIKMTMLAFLPGILGFTIAGYALVVGFVNGNMLSEITEPSKDSKYSLYQKMSSTFALNVIFQCFALILAYMYHFIIYFGLEAKFDFALSQYILSLINFMGLLFLSFWFIISLFLIIQIIINIFNFSQLHHYFINKEKINNLNKDEPKNDSK